MGFASIFFGAGLMLMSKVSEIWHLYLFASVYGLAHGGFFTAISPIVAEIFGVASHGAIFGMIVFSGTVGGSAGPVLAGKIFDSMGSYALAFQMITVLSVTSLGLIILVNPIRDSEWR